MGEIVKGAFNGRKTSRDLAAEATTQLATIAKTMAAIASARTTLRSALIDLSLEMANRIVHKSIDLDPVLLDEIYAGALESVQGLQGAAVTVHPADRGLSTIDALASKLAFSVREDEAVGRGGCRIVLGVSEVDATLPMLLEAFRMALKGTEHVST